MKKAAKKKAAKKKTRKKKKTTVDKPVRVTLQGSGLRINPPRLRIYPKRKHQLVWSAPKEGALLVDFDKGQGTPFAQSSFRAAAGRKVASGIPVVSPNPSEYFGYSVYVTLTAGGNRKKDPGVDVDGSTPPGGGRKKAAKKATKKKAAKKKASRKKATRKKAAKKKAAGKKK